MKDMDIDGLITGPWDTIALYTLTQEQADALLSRPDIVAQRGWLPARYRFPEHAHAEPQLLLVTRGRLTHTSGGISYTQTPGDLLVVPARLKHTAIIGDEQLEFFLILKAGNREH
jgi:mannose-6-phosphate isomerase-like protein (cupin superfamily)